MDKEAVVSYWKKMHSIKTAIIAFLPIFIMEAIVIIFFLFNLVEIGLYIELVVFIQIIVTVLFLFSWEFLFKKNNEAIIALYEIAQLEKQIKRREYFLFYHEWPGRNEEVE